MSDTPSPPPLNISSPDDLEPTDSVERNVPSESTTNSTAWWDKDKDKSKGDSGTSGGTTSGGASGGKDSKK